MRNFSDIVAQHSDDEDEELSDGIPSDVDDEVLRTRHTNVLFDRTCREGLC